MRKAALLVLLTALVVTVGILSIAGPSVEATENSDIAQQNITLSDDQDIGEQTLSWAPIPFPIPPSSCGGNVCGPGQYCCNPSCGTCVDFGNYCTQQVCNPVE